MEVVDEIQIDTRLYLIVDNRLFPSLDVSTEAYLTSYYRGIQPLLVESVSFLCRERWNAYPITLASASSAQTVQLTHLNYESAHLLFNILEPKYSSLGGSMAANSSWQNYLTDAIKKLTQYTISQPNYQQNQAIQKIMILIYSTEVALFGDFHSCGSIQEGLNAFKLSCEQILSLRDFIEIRIVCFGLFSNQLSLAGTKSSFLSTNSESNSFLFHSNILQAFPEKVSIERRLCSVINFDEEYKLLIGLSSPKKIVKLELPPFQATECSVMIELSTSYVNTVRSMIPISSFEVCGTCSRSGINPMYLFGNALHVNLPHHGIVLRALQCKERYLNIPFLLIFSINGTSKFSVAENAMLFSILTKFLASRNLMFILRGRMKTLPSQPCFSYWTLVPPIDEATSSMSLIQVVDRDDIILNVPNRCDDLSEPREMYAAMSEEMDIYLDEALNSSFGPPTDYNPFFYTKGQLKVYKSLKTQLSR